jgi:hypothetical protein
MFPAANKATVLAKRADVDAAVAKFDAAASDRHTKDQWCNSVVTKADTAVSCAFRTASA